MIEAPDSFSLMYACEPKPKHPIQFPGVFSYKLDGIRSGVLYGRTYTRSSKEVPNDFTRLRLNYCEGLDGEFIIGPPNAPDVFDLSTSAFRRIGGEPDFRVYAFDRLIGTNVYKLESRLKLLAEDVPLWNYRIRTIFGDQVDRIILLPQKWITCMEELEAAYAEALELGYEGGIYKAAGKLYKHGRSTSLSQEQLKMKPLADSEAKVIKFIEGTVNHNKPFINERGLQERSSHQENLVPSGMLGKIHCMDIYTGVEFYCSPGKMTHDMRKEVWNNQDQYSTEIFKYLFFPVGSYDKPRMNRWAAWRAKSDIDLSKAKHL